jgi:hypothetical protein
MKEYFSANRSHNSLWNSADSCSKWSTSPRLLKSYFPMIDIEILALDIFDKRWKNIFQPADPIILPENLQIPALSEAHLRDGLITKFACRLTEKMLSSKNTWLFDKSPNLLTN